MTEREFPIPPALCFPDDISPEEYCWFIEVYHQSFECEFNRLYEFYLELHESQEDALFYAIDDASNFARDVAKMTVPSCRNAYFGDVKDYIDFSSLLKG